MHKTSALGLALIVGTCFLVGCGNSTSGTSSPEEAKNFKGGPMPPDVAKKFAESQKKAAENIAKKQTDKQ